MVADYIDNLVSAIVETHRNGKKVLICGNGGLAAESEHFAAELSGKFAFEVYVPCIALTANSALVTAISNDMGFDNLFAHQVSVLGVPGDLLIGMTTSRSINVLKAIDAARSKDIRTCVLLSSHSGDVGADFSIIANGLSVAEVQNSIIQLLHEAAYQVKERLCSETSA